MDRIPGGGIFARRRGGTEGETEEMGLEEIAWCRRRWIRETLVYSLDSPVSRRAPGEKRKGGNGSAPHWK